MKVGGFSEEFGTPYVTVEDNNGNWDPEELIRFCEESGAVHYGLDDYCVVIKVEFAGRRTGIVEAYAYTELRRMQRTPSA